MTATAARIGIVGAGRLGRALALRLAGRYEITLADIEPKLTKQFTKRHGLRFCYPDDVPADNDVVLLCVPPAAVHRALLDLARAARRTARPHRLLCLDTATSVESAAPDTTGLEPLDVIGLRPIGQYAAIQRGEPAVFVTADRRLPMLQGLVGDLGLVIHGDERLVGTLNRQATTLALRACDAAWEQLAPLCPDDAARRAAIRNVFAGTAMDYPPSPDNTYIAALRDRMAEAPGPQPVGAA
ncbi:MAG: NAD(P)-binding domain-containing protein [Pseudonocardiaceae bacterium]